MKAPGIASLLVVLGVIAACSSAGTAGGLDGPSDGGSGGSSAGSGGAGAGAGAGGGISLAGAGQGGMLNLGGQTGGDPDTCEGAAALKSYVGCDYWPTVTANGVWSIFDFAVIVVNSGSSPADVKVTRGGNQIAQVSVAPDTLEKIYLPWVSELKGPDSTTCGTAGELVNTVGVVAGAYHLESSRPVSVYQFNALEYAGKGGPPGKSWASCPGNQICDDFTSQSFGAAIGCFSFSNDASLLLPTTALTGNYRVSAPKGLFDPSNPAGGGIGAYFTITGTADGTTVKVKLSATGKTQAGAGIQAKGPGDVVTFSMNQGDVLELASPPDADLSGSLVQADKPVQVISGIPCALVPDLKTGACDHLEETVLPAETLGQHYVVSPPTGPRGDVPGHVVRLLGNVDSTQLTYKGQKPANAPSTLNAGQLVDLGLVKGSFEIEGDHEFIVSTFMLGAGKLDPNAKTGEQKGDPSMSISTAVEQYRKKYVFLAPDDYDISVADVIAPEGTSLTLDGKQISAKFEAISGTGFGVFRIKLGPGQGGAHLLTSDKEVGLQVMGYGSYTSYQYPGGSNLTLIAPPPPDIN